MLYFESKASLFLTFFSTSVIFILLTLTLKGFYDIYVDQTKEGRQIGNVTDAVPPVDNSLPEIDFSKEPFVLTEPQSTYDSLTVFKIKEASITLLKKGYDKSAIEILSKHESTSKLGNYLQKMNTLKEKKGYNMKLLTYLKVRKNGEKR